MASTSTNVPSRGATADGVKDPPHGGSRQLLISYPSSTPLRGAADGCPCGVNTGHEGRYYHGGCGITGSDRVPFAFAGNDDLVSSSLEGSRVLPREWSARVYEGAAGDRTTTESSTTAAMSSSDTSTIHSSSVVYRTAMNVGIKERPKDCECDVEGGGNHGIGQCHGQVDVRHPAMDSSAVALGAFVSLMKDAAPFVHMDAVMLHSGLEQVETVCGNLSALICANY